VRAGSTSAVRGLAAGDRSGDWRDAAACVGWDPELFFPVGTAGPALAQIGEARAVCRSCPVVAPCLAWALDAGCDYGVWGGRSEDERRGLRRDRVMPRRVPEVAGGGSR